MEEKNRKLIVYFSYTNHTRMIVENIQKILKIDVLEIKPKKQYSNDYDIVVSEEQNSSSENKMPEIEKIDINLDDYDEIILGTPVWWYTIAPVIRTFLSENDLSGKTIIPFATNAGWLGHTFKEIKKLCLNSIIRNEMNIVFTMNYTDNKLETPMIEIENWINML